jgi:hypothetical protein
MPKQRVTLLDGRVIDIDVDAPADASSVARSGGVDYTGATIGDISANKIVGGNNTETHNHYHYPPAPTEVPVPPSTIPVVERAVRPPSVALIGYNTGQPLAGLRPQLQRLGLVPLRSSYNLVDDRDELRTLAADAAVLWLPSKALRDPALREHLQPLLDREKATPTLPLFFAFERTRPTEKVLQSLGIRWSDDDGRCLVVAAAPGQREQDLAVLARRVLGAMPSDFFLIDEQQAVPLAFSFHPQAVAPPEGVALSLEWESLDRPVPLDPQLWAALPDALSAVKNALKWRADVVRLRGSARISAALVFGYIFRETTLFNIWVQGRDGMEWRTRRSNSDDLPLVEEHIALDPAAQDVTLEINITQPRGKVQESVDEWIARTQPSLRRRIILNYSASGDVTDYQGAAIAARVRELLLAERQRGTVHIFAAIPMTLAVFLGWRLHTCAPFQTYEFDEDRRYQAACLIRS